MRRRFGSRLAAIAVMTAAIGATGAGGAQAATSDDPDIVFDTPTVTIPYGQQWYLSAVVENAAEAYGLWTPSATMTNAPSGYAPAVEGYQAGSIGYNAFTYAPSDTRPLPAGSYTVTLSITGSYPDSPTFSSNPPAQLTVTPAALAIAVKAIPDPSNPSNLIISAAFTGEFFNWSLATSEPWAPLMPSGTWRLTATNADGEVLHEFSLERSELDDLRGVSTYWSDVPPGEYTIRAEFVPTGETSDNFAIAAADPITYAASPAPGSTSTAAPAPPAPEDAEDAGLTLPGWIPLTAGILTAVLLALTIVQIVRLRRSLAPQASGS